MPRKTETHSHLFFCSFSRGIILLPLSVMYYWESPPPLFPTLTNTVAYKKHDRKQNWGPSCGFKKNILESKNRFCYKKLKSLRFTNLSRESPSSSFSDLIGVYFVPGLIKYLPVMLVLPHANIISSREDEGTVGSLKYFGRYILLLVNVPKIMSLNKLRFEWEQVIKSQSSTLKSLMGHASHELKANFTLGPITSLLTMIMISRCP